MHPWLSPTMPHQVSEDVPPDSDDSTVAGFVGVEEEEQEMGGEGVSAEDLIYMSPQEVEAKLAAVVAYGMMEPLVCCGVAPWCSCIPQGHRAAEGCGSASLHLSVPRIEGG